MKPCLLDTDILSLFTYYEILSGLKHRDAQKQLDKFLEFSQLNQILLLTKESVTISAKIYAELRKKGTPLDEFDFAHRKWLGQNSNGSLSSTAVRSVWKS